MSTLSIEKLPEVIISDSHSRREISRLLAKGKIRRIIRKVYTKNLTEDLTQIVLRNLWQIVGGLFPESIIVDRTAIENIPALDGSVFIASTQKNIIHLPGITIRPRKGAPPISGDMPFVAGLYLSSRARAFLENIKDSRSRNKAIPRTLSQKELEERLEKILVISGEKALNDLRDQAKIISKELGLKKEYELLNNLIGTFLGTKSLSLQSNVGLARQKGAPYDSKRIDLFQTLFIELKNTPPIFRTKIDISESERINMAFFEAYFSNFIEGTEFDLSEAYDIIFKGKIPQERPEDAHDILGTFKIVSNLEEMQIVPKTFDQFLQLIKERHALFMEGRELVSPGIFKTMPNKAGSTVFVDPDLVFGTLLKGYELYQAIENPFHKAVYMMFLIAEVHPFKDGNGRLARIMMNAELVSQDEQRIIIPTIYRNNYLSALRALSLNHKAAPLIQVLDFAQRYTSRLPLQSFEATREALNQTHAFENPNIADEQGLRLILPF